MNAKTRRYSILKLFVLFLILLIIDQSTKYFASICLKSKDGYPIIPGVFEMYYLENRGAAYGMFQNRQWLFIIFGLAIFVGIIVLLFRMTPLQKRYRPLAITLTFLAAGDIGNLIDRFIHRYVIDFFYFKWIDFPVFNVADCYVVLSMVILLYLLFFYYKDQELEKIWKGNGGTNGND